MIKKLWCWFWGHKITYDAYTGKTEQVTGFMGERVVAPIINKTFYDYCPRCGVRLVEDGQRQD